MALDGVVKYRDLLSKLSQEQGWVGAYTKELGIKEVIEGLKKQTQELRKMRPELKEVVLERQQNRLAELRKRWEVRMDSVAKKLLAGDPTSGHPYNTSETELLTQIAKVEELIEAVGRQDNTENDKTCKRIDSDIKERERDIKELQGKISSTQKGRHPFRVDGTLDLSTDLWELYTQNLLESHNLNAPGTEKPFFSEQDKKLLALKGVKIDDKK